MLLIPCPHCGERNESEFVNGGPVRVQRPADPRALDATAWVDWLTVGPNPMGPVREKWWHKLGCGTWFVVSRDTVTHQIVRDAGPLTSSAETGRG